MQHVELTKRTRALYAAFGAGDWDAFFAQTDPEVEWTPLDENVSYHGRAEVTRHFERRRAGWVDFRLELESVEVSENEDRILVAARYEGRLGGSEKRITGGIFSLIELRAGRFWRGEEYPTKDQAREAMQWRE